MLIKTASFIISNTDYTKCPSPSFPEYAFIGRSNVGKSSLINMLTGRKTLAKTSVTPGKTRLINHFLINEEWYLVDLPGYGYAKVSKKEKGKWERIIKAYLQHRTNLLCVMVLIDSRLVPQKNDMEFMHWLGKSEIPFCLVFTKLDKLGKSTWEKNFTDYTKEMLKQWECLPPVFCTSAINQKGKEELLQFISETNGCFKN